MSVCGILSTASVVRTLTTDDDAFRRLVALDDVDVNVVDDDALLMKLVLSICSSLDAFVCVQHQLKG